MKKLAKQMELFEEGGLMDEGGSVDEVSGNEVPPGSLKEEVRDDIPAQLSEGEFVFPADVVRYYGLETLMEMRQRAKAGLQRMEEMGQMGNSDEATLPDDIPFSIEDLDIEEENEYNYQVGGFVPPQGSGIAGYQQSQFANYQPTYTPYSMAAIQPTAPTYQVPQQQYVPTMQVPAQLPTFEQFTQAPEGMAPENREYINPATGERRIFTFISGNPTTAIPEGFIPISEYTEPEPVTTTPTVGQTRVTETGDRGREDGVSKYGGATISLGGTVKNGLIQGGNVYGLMFDQFSLDMAKNMGLPGLVKGILGGEPRKLEEGMSATIVDTKTDTKVSIPASVYNDIRSDLTGKTANEVRAVIEKVNSFKEAGATNEDLNKAWADEQTKNIANRIAVDKARETGNWGSVISNAVKEAEAMVEADTGYDEDLGTAPTAPSTPSGDSGDRPDRSSGGDSYGGRSDSSGRGTGSAGSGSFGMGPRAKGGLISKPKKKAK